MLSRLIAVRTNDVCSSEYSRACTTAGTPAADFLGASIFGFSTPVASLAVIHRGLSLNLRRAHAVRSALEDLEFLGDFADRLLGVAEEHCGAVGVEQRVLDACEAGVHRPLQHYHGLGLIDVED